MASHQMCQITANPVDGGKEGADHPGRRIARHLDCLVARLVHKLALLERTLLHAPIGFGAMHVGKHREIERRRRRQSRPFQRPAVPWIAGDVAALVAGPYRDVELHDREDDAGKDEQCADKRGDHVRLPVRIVIMLHPPRRAHQAEDVERQEGKPEADEPAPETRPCPAARRG